MCDLCVHALLLHANTCCLPWPQTSHLHLLQLCPAGCDQCVKTWGVNFSLAFAAGGLEDELAAFAGGGSWPGLTLKHTKQQVGAHCFNKFPLTVAKHLFLPEALKPAHQ